MTVDSTDLLLADLMVYSMVPSKVVVKVLQLAGLLVFQWVVVLVSGLVVLLDG
jgi:hypothetical protein